MHIQRTYLFDMGIKILNTALKMSSFKEELKVTGTSDKIQKHPKKYKNIDTNFLGKYVDQEIIDTLSRSQIKELKRTYVSSRKYDVE